MVHAVYLIINQFVKIAEICDPHSALARKDGTKNNLEFEKLLCAPKQLHE